jgi:hypothetical protein
MGGSSSGPNAGIFDECDCAVPALQANTSSAVAATEPAVRRGRLRIVDEHGT